MPFFVSKQNYLIVIFVFQIIISFSNEEIININNEDAQEKQLVNDANGERKIDTINQLSEVQKLDTLNDEISKEKRTIETEIITTSKDYYDSMKSVGNMDIVNPTNDEVESGKRLDETITNKNVIENINSLNNINTIDSVNSGEDIKIESQDVEELKNSTDHSASNVDDIKKKKSSKESASADKLNTNATISDKTVNVTKYICSQDVEYGPVELANATRLIDILKEMSANKNSVTKEKDGKMQPAPCLLAMFYATWCIFSSQAAPHFNALPKFFPHIKFVAIDAMKHQHLNTHYGIVGVPTLMLIHDGKPAAKFNDTVYSLETFAKFITHLTTLQPNGSLQVTFADFSGPVSSVPVSETDYCLILSWAFIAICAMYFTSQSQWWRQFVELVQNTWRESNAQHEHVE